MNKTKAFLLSVATAACCISDTAFAGEPLPIYQPQVKHVVIHEGKLAQGHYAYNHMASVEWFDGRFHVVWGAHAETHLEGKPGQVNVWATSGDFQQWSAPRKLAHTGPGALTLDPQCVQWQPVCDFPLDQWHAIRLVVRGADFSVSVDGQSAQTFPNPLVNPAPRLYLGDGFDVDYIYSLSGSEFLVDLGSLQSRVR